MINQAHTIGTQGQGEGISHKHTYMSVRERERDRVKEIRKFEVRPEFK